MNLESNCWKKSREHYYGCIWESLLNLLKDSTFSKTHGFSIKSLCQRQRHCSLLHHQHPLQSWQLFQAAKTFLKVFLKTSSLQSCPSTHRTAHWIRLESRQSQRYLEPPHHRTEVLNFRLGTHFWEVLSNIILHLELRWHEIHSCSNKHPAHYVEDVVCPSTRCYYSISC